MRASTMKPLTEIIQAIGFDASSSRRQNSGSNCPMRRRGSRCFAEEMFRLRDEKRRFDPGREHAKRDLECGGRRETLLSRESLLFPNPALADCGFDLIGDSTSTNGAQLLEQLGVCGARLLFGG